MRHRNLSKSFADVLRKHRKQRQITQETLAEKADVASKMVSLIERGEINPSLNLMDSLAQGLEIPLAEMIAEAEKNRKRKK